MYKRICDNSCNGVIRTFQSQILKRNKNGRRVNTDWNTERYRTAQLWGEKNNDRHFPWTTILNSMCWVKIMIFHISASRILNFLVFHWDESGKRMIFWLMFVHICIPFLPWFLYFIFVYMTSNIFRLETDLVPADNFRKSFWAARQNSVFSFPTIEIEF